MDLLHSCEITWNIGILETKNRKAHLDAVKFKIEKKIELGKTFNLHPNFTYAKDVWSLYQFYTLFIFSRACIFSKNYFFFKLIHTNNYLNSYFI